MIFSAQATRDYWTPVPAFLTVWWMMDFSSSANIHYTAKLVRKRSLAPVYRGFETSHGARGGYQPIKRRIKWRELPWRVVVYG